MAPDADVATLTYRFPLSREIDEGSLRLLHDRLLWMSPLIRSTERSDGVIEVTFSVEPESELVRRLQDEVERRVAASEVPRRPSDALSQHRGAPYRFDAKAVQAELIRRGDLVPFGKGTYGYTGDFLRLLHRLRARFVSIGEAHGAREYDYPTVVDLAIADRAGYLHRFPQHAYLLNHLRQDTDELDSLSAALKARSPSTSVPEALRAAAAEPEWIANPLGCYHVFQQLEGTHIPEPQGRTHVSFGRCMRYEAGGVEGLARLNNYSLVEFVTVGPPQHVESVSTSLQQALVAFARQLDLTYDVTPVADRFFGPDDRAVGMLQELAGLKLEIGAELPGRGAPLAISSVNRHRDFFTEEFAIAGAGGASLHSSCAGCGLERWALAVMCRHGVAYGDWSPFLAERPVGTGTLEPE